MNGLPYFKFYTSDWRKSLHVKRMTYEERGVFFELLIWAWDSDDCTLDGDPIGLLSIIGDKDVWERTKDVVLKQFDHHSEGKIHNKRLMQEFEAAQKYTENQRNSGKIGAEKRWKGRHSKPNRVAIATPMAKNSQTETDLDLKDPPLITSPRNTSKKTTQVPASFEAFWLAYPNRRKTNKPKCIELWKAGDLESICEELMAGLSRCKASADWTKDDGEFIPGPAVWLRRQGWNDVMEAANANANGHAKSRGPRILNGPDGSTVEAG